MDFQSFVLTHDYTVDSAGKQYSFRGLLINGHDNKTSDAEAFESMNGYSLTTQWYTQLRLPKMPATVFAYTYFDTVEPLQYLGHFHATKL